MLMFFLYSAILQFLSAIWIFGDVNLNKQLQRKKERKKYKEEYRIP